MGRTVVSIHDFKHLEDLLQKTREQLWWLISDQLDFMEHYRRYMDRMATALSWIRTLDYWLDQLRKETQSKR
ncbi:hypothetical protein DRO54_08740 [Candidatus Bathyarchaeota archaeon]|nr:MAG: hypothetical protein DRO54_08740 [Candidatus Bathyarchaeota archaeon]